MSTSQHTIAHARKSTSAIHPNGVSCPDHNQHQHHRYENIVLDLLQSDILSVLPAHLKAVVLLGAGLANSDNRDGRYRSFYFQQGWTAERLGISRQAFSSYLGTVVKHGVLIKLGKGYPKNRRKGDQPVIFYAVPDFEDLCRLAATKTKDDFTRKKSPADVARIVDNAQRLSTTALQPPTERVSSGRDTLLSSGRDTLTERLSTGRDTKRDLLLKIDKGNGKEVHPSRNGDNKKPTSTPTSTAIPPLTVLTASPRSNVHAATPSRLRNGPPAARCAKRAGRKSKEPRTPSERKRRKKTSKTTKRGTESLSEKNGRTWTKPRELTNYG